MGGHLTLLLRTLPPQLQKRGMYDPVTSTWVPQLPVQTLAAGKAAPQAPPQVRTPVKSVDWGADGAVAAVQAPPANGAAK